MRTGSALEETGVPPTARNARTGEFTPPGMRRWARSKALHSSSSEKAPVLACARRDVGRIEKIADDGEEISACADERGRVLNRDAADCAARRAEVVCEKLKRRAHRAGLGRTDSTLRRRCSPRRAVPQRALCGCQRSRTQDLSRELGARGRRSPSSLPRWTPFAPTASAMSRSSFTMKGTP